MAKEEHPLYPPSVLFGLALGNVSSLPYGETELGLLSQVSQLAFSQGGFFQKGAHLELGRTVVTSEPS